MSVVPLVIYENGIRHVIGSVKISADGEMVSATANTEVGKKIMEDEIVNFSFEPTWPEVIGVRPSRDYSIELLNPIYKSKDN